MPIFDWSANNPEQASLFSETMVGFHGAEPPAVAAAYDFSGLRTIVDVGGATGNLLEFSWRRAGRQGAAHEVGRAVLGAPGTT